MIQRKQSLWLLLAALLNAGVLFFDLYRSHSMVNGVDVTGRLRVADHFPSLLIALVMTGLPLITIFMFRDRKRQMRLTIAAVIATLSFLSISLLRVGNLGKQVPPPTDGSYWVGAILPAIAIVFLFLALGGIRRDEKLVKSVDRLR
jgi:hypothetical protein